MSATPRIRSGERGFRRAASWPRRLTVYRTLPRSLPARRGSGSASLSLLMMRKILVTGMSGTGKSSALTELDRLGFRVVDTDVGGWSEWSDAEGGYAWREERMTQLLAQDDGPSLYVSGTVSNQGRFYDRFDAIVLLSAPAEVLLSRIQDRETNSYGKSPEQRELVLRHLVEVEPLLRRTCTHELDAAEPLANIVAQLAELAGEPSA
jgi:shikimate kinase